MPNDHQLTELERETVLRAVQNVEEQLRSAEQKRQEASRQHADRFDSIVRAVEENTGAVRELAAELEKNKRQDADQDGKLRELEARYAELARSQGRAGGVQSGSVAGMVGALVLAVVCALLAKQGVHLPFCGGP